MAARDRTHLGWVSARSARCCWHGSVFVVRGAGWGVERERRTGRGSGRREVQIGKFDGATPSGNNSQGRPRQYLGTWKYVGCSRARREEKDVDDVGGKGRKSASDGGTRVRCLPGECLFGELMAHVASLKWLVLDLSPLCDVL